MTTTRPFSNIPEEEWNPEKWIVSDFFFQENFNNVPQCHSPGCKEPSIMCLYPGMSKMYYCVDHAGNNGFCAICGEHFGGMRIGKLNICPTCEQETALADSFPGRARVILIEDKSAEFPYVSFMDKFEEITGMDLEDFKSAGEYCHDRFTLRWVYENWILEYFEETPNHRSYRLLLIE